MISIPENSIIINNYNVKEIISIDESKTADKIKNNLTIYS